MDKHVNHSNLTTPSEDQLDWVEQMNPAPLNPFSSGQGSSNKSCLVVGATRAGKTSLRVFGELICHGGQDHE